MVVVTACGVEIEVEVEVEVVVRFRLYPSLYFWPRETNGNWPVILATACTESPTL